MKFGKLLRHTVDSRMPQWRNYTLAYKQLKQHIKQLQAQLAQQGARSPAQLSSRLPECTSPVPHHAWTALEPAVTPHARGQRQFCAGLTASSLWLTRPLPCPGISPDAASSSVTAALDLEVEKVNDFYMDRIEEAVIILHSLKQHAEQLVRWRSNRGPSVAQRLPLSPASRKLARPRLSSGPRVRRCLLACPLSRGPPANGHSWPSTTTCSPCRTTSRSTLLLW